MVMRYWINEDWIRMCEPNTADEWLKFIWEIGFDYDGENCRRPQRTD